MSSVDIRPWWAKGFLFRYWGIEPALEVNQGLVGDRAWLYAETKHGYHITIRRMPNGYVLDVFMPPEDGKDEPYSYTGESVEECYEMALNMTGEKPMDILGRMHGGRRGGWAEGAE